jgi:ketosteroid isomerase-like protein
MSQENVEVVRRSLEAEDSETAFADARPDLEWVVAKQHPASRTLHGREEVVRYLEEWAETLRDMRFVVEDYRESGDGVVAIGKVRGTGEGSGVLVEVPLSLVYRFEGSKFARVEEYLDSSEALEAAGLRK